MAFSDGFESNKAKQRTFKSSSTKQSITPRASRKHKESKIIVESSRDPEVSRNSAAFSPRRVLKRSYHQLSACEPSTSAHCPTSNSKLELQSHSRSQDSKKSSELGASASKKRRRDRQRTVLCQSTGDVDQPKESIKQCDFPKTNLPPNSRDGSLDVAHHFDTSAVNMPAGNENLRKTSNKSAVGFHDLRSRSHNTQAYLLPSSVNQLPNTANPNGSSETTPTDLSNSSTRLRHHSSDHTDPSSASLPNDELVSDIHCSTRAAQSMLEQLGVYDGDLSSLDAAFAPDVVDSRSSSAKFKPFVIMPRGKKCLPAGSSHALGEQSDSAGDLACSMVTYLTNENLPSGTSTASHSDDNSSVDAVITSATYPFNSSNSADASPSSGQSYPIFHPVHMRHFIGIHNQGPSHCPKAVTSKTSDSTSAQPSKQGHHHESGQSSSATIYSRTMALLQGNRPGQHLTGINNRIEQLLQMQDDRSMQLVLLQDINQILLMGFEENLANLNIRGLVSCILDILDSADDHLIDLKNLGCNVLTHMMDVIPRSSDAVLPALPVLLTTMSSSFVGDILERVINLLEQLSRRHGKEVLRSGAIGAVMGFYDFVTLAQHRTILTMVSNCFVNLHTSDFDLIVNTLPSLIERLKESDSRCVERVCTCFARLVAAYRSEPSLLEKIVTESDLFSNLQHLVMSTPPILSTVRDVVHMLSVFCSSCPQLAVQLIKKNFAVTFYCILTGKTLDSTVLTNLLLAPLGTNQASPISTHTTKRCRPHSGSKWPPIDASSWTPLMLTVSPIPESCPGLPPLSINNRNQDEVHAIVQLICELLPRIPEAYWATLKSAPALSKDNSEDNVEEFKSHKRAFPRRSESERVPSVSSERRPTRCNTTHRLSFPLDQSVINRDKSVTSVSTESLCSSGTLKHDCNQCNESNASVDPRAHLLQSECVELHRRFGLSSTDTVRARRSSLRTRCADHQSTGSDEAAATSIGSMEALQVVQTLLPLLFELFTEATQLQTRLKCLEAIQRMLFYSSPLLLAKTLRPRVVCSHIVGMLNCPEKRIILAGLNIVVLLVSRLPALFITYFRKEGILHQVDSIRMQSGSKLASDSTANVTCRTSSVLKHSSPISPGESLTQRPSQSGQNSGVPLSESNDTSRPSTRSTERRTSSTRQLPTLACAMDDGYPYEELFCEMISSICDHFSTCVNSFTDASQLSVCSVASSSSHDTREQFDLTGDSTIGGVDVTGRLSTIARSLLSEKPTSWIVALEQLIELLQPTGTSEPPSPFEMQTSGVTAALLRYLAEPELREIRVWIFYRLFFESHLGSNRQISPADYLNWMCKKHATSKNYPNLFDLTPDLVDSTRLEQLRQFDQFLNKRLKESNVVRDGSGAFTTLVNCLLTCFHRHEQFQVRGLPSMMTVDNKLYPLYSSIITASFKAGTSDPSLGRLLEHPNSQRVRTNRSNNQSSDNPGSCSREIPVGNTFVSMKPRQTRRAPLPGLISIELVRLPNERSESGGVQSTPSPRPSGSRTSNTKGARKSSGSSSSPSSNNSSLTSTVTGYGLSLPERYELQTTALATFQIVERILLQRNYINTILSDGILPGEHEFNLNNFAEVCASIGSAEEHLRDIIDARSRDSSRNLKWSSDQLRESSNTRHSHVTSRSQRFSKPDALGNLFQLLPEQAEFCPRSLLSSCSLRQGNIIVVPPDSNPEPLSNEAVNDYESSKHGSKPKRHTNLSCPSPSSQKPGAALPTVSSTRGKNERQTVGESCTLRPRSVAKASSSQHNSSASSSHLHPTSHASTSGIDYSHPSARVSAISKASSAKVQNSSESMKLDAPLEHERTITRTVAGSRRRRSRGNSILAAFGALTHLSTEPSDRKNNPKHVKNSGSTHSTRLGKMPISLSPSTSSSMSSVNHDDSTALLGKRHSRIAFYIGGHRLPSTMPLFEAIRKFSPDINRLIAHLQKPNQSDQSILGGAAVPQNLTHDEIDELISQVIWNMTHVIQYRWVPYQHVTATKDSAASQQSSSKKSNLSFASLYRSKIFSGHSKSSGSRSGTSQNPSNISSAMTCIKRRRSDEVVEHMQIESPGSCDSMQSPGGIPYHPLFSGLTLNLPRGFSNEITCCCSPSKCPGDVISSAVDTSQIVDETLTTSLTLLRVLHNLSRFWYTIHNTFDPAPIVSPLVFRSPKLALKANRQLQDAFNILAGNLPTWLTQLISSCPFLFPFDTRRSFFYAYNFDRERTLARIQDASPSSLTEIEQLANSRVPRGLAPPISMSNDSSFTAGASPSSNGSGTSSDYSMTSRVSSNPTSLGNWLPSSDQPSAPTSSYRPDGYVSFTRGRYHTRLALSSNIRRHKVTVPRDGKRLLKQAETTLTDMLDSNSVLEIAFEGEVGFGLGPTLEFYTLVSRQLMKSSLGLWHGSEQTHDGYHIAPAPGLYPRPLPRHSRSNLMREVRSKFLFLGRLMARVLLDWRQLDLPFSPAFFKWFLADTPLQAVTQGHILPNDLALIDPELARHMRQLSEIVTRRELFCEQLRQLYNPDLSSLVTHIKSSVRHSMGTAFHFAQREIEELKDKIAAIDDEVEDLCLNFTLPGYEIELLKNGAHVSVTGSNLSEYIRLVAHWLVIEGVSRQMEAVLEGFDSVLPNARQRLAVLFQPDEMEGLFCGRSSQFTSVWSDSDLVIGERIIAVGEASSGWDVQTLSEACRCDHGYTLQSKTIRNLFEVLSEFNEEQRRLFVQFVTGSPRLPVGGFRALKPPLKIVMKREGGDNADNHLPSVMTCQNYLKLPDYSSKELLLSKLLYAISEGQNAFHLS